MVHPGSPLYAVAAQALLLPYCLAVPLCRWYTKELPLAVAARAPLSIVKAELVQLVEWKLLRGKWRPRLLDYAQQQEEGGVQQASESAFKVGWVRGLTISPPIHSWSPSILIVHSMAGSDLGKYMFLIITMLRLRKGHKHPIRLPRWGEGPGMAAHRTPHSPLPHLGSGYGCPGLFSVSYQVASQASVADTSP